MNTAALGLLLLLQAGSTGPASGSEPVWADSSRLTSFEFAPIASPQYAGDSFEITIFAKDQYNANFAYSGSALLTTSLGPFVMPGSVSFYAGVLQRRVAVSLAGNMQLRCIADSAQGSSNSFDVFPGVPSRLVTILPGEQLARGVPGGRSGRPESQIAGDTFTFSVHLTDEWYNLITMREDSVYLGATDRFAVLPLGGKLSNGTASFLGRVRAAGRHRLFARPAAGSSVEPDSSTAFSVVPGSFAEMLLVVPGETVLPGDTASRTWQTPGKSGSPEVQFLRTPFPVWVYPTDECWNVITGPGDTVFLRSDFAFEFTPGTGELRAPASFMVQFNTPGPNQDIWVANQQSGDQSYRTRLDIRALGQGLEVFAPETVRAGETIPVRVVVRDANDQPIVAALVRTSVFLGNGDILDPSILTDTLGTATARFLATRAQMAEQDSVRITSGSASATIGIYVDITDSAVMNGRVISFPNPFGLDHQSTEISYYLQSSSDITLNIYDPFGNTVWSRKFRRGEDGARAGLNRRIYWDGRNQRGHRVASGIYVLEVVGDVFTGTTFKSHYRIGVVW